jgi:hypothetical protein
MIKGKILLFISLGLVLGGVFFQACSSPSSTQPPTVAKEDPSFAGDIQPIFSGSCAASSCHGASVQAGLSIVQGQSYANLVNIGSTEDVSRKRVLPGDAANSYIVIKLEGRQTVGAKMPLGGSLDAVSLQNIKNWINRGAKNN